MTLVPALHVDRTPRFVVGGGSLPLQVTVASADQRHDHRHAGVRGGDPRPIRQRGHHAHLDAAGRCPWTPAPGGHVHGHRLGDDQRRRDDERIPHPHRQGHRRPRRSRYRGAVWGWCSRSRSPFPSLSPPTRRPTLDQPPRQRPLVGADPLRRDLHAGRPGFAPGATETFTDRRAVWAATGTHTITTTVRSLSNTRAVQLLAQLGYLPLNFITHTPVARNAGAQAEAATSPPAGTYKWRYAHAPSALVHLWTSNRGVMLRGAYMAFEVDHHLAMDGALRPGVWRALEQAAISGRGNRFGYSFVHVYRGLPQHVVVWHNGRNVFSTLANTGIPGRPTNYGIFPIFLRQTVGTMSGTNPNGSTYHDSWHSLDQLLLRRRRAAPVLTSRLRLPAESRLRRDDQRRRAPSVSAHRVRNARRHAFLAIRLTSGRGRPFGVPIGSPGHGAGSEVVREPQQHVRRRVRDQQ